jgi:hypothetical protein
LQGAAGGRLSALLRSFLDGETGDAHMLYRLPAILISAAIGFPIAPAFAQNAELPARKSGQWEIKMIPDTPGAAPEMSIEACVDAASDQEMMRAGLSMAEGMCSHQEIRQEGATYVIDSTCNIGPMKTESHIVISGDFQSAYKVNVTTVTTGAMAPMAGTNEMVQEARWVGPQCTDGMVPGDMLMPGGRKVNVNEMMKTMGGG